MANALLAIKAMLENANQNSQLPMSITSDFKKDYEWMWTMNWPNLTKGIFDSGNNTSVSKTVTTQMGSGYFEEVFSLDYGYTVFKDYTHLNPATLNYICRLAQSVDLPSLQLETEEIEMGMYSVPVGTKLNYGNVKVTYLDDLFETVYKVHNNWIQLAGTGEVPLNKIAMEGHYYVTSSAIVALLEAMFPIVKPFISILTLGEAAGEGYVATSESRFPLLIPTEVSRSSADKSSNNLSKVSVTYKQIFVVDVEGSGVYDLNNTGEASINNVIYSDRGIRGSNMFDYYKNLQAVWADSQNVSTLLNGGHL